MLAMPLRRLRPLGKMQRISFILLFTVVMPLLSCAGTRPNNLGVKEERLAPCPPSPNCVSSDADDPSHLVPAFHLAAPPPDGWRAARAAVASLPRTAIITETDNYLYVECRSAFFGFVDDLELHLRPEHNIIAVRSAARLGRSDFDVNRKRVETIRALLIRQGAVRQLPSTHGLRATKSFLNSPPSSHMPRQSPQASTITERSAAL